jgi:hypothetical protein
VYRSVRAKGDTKTRRSRRVLKLPAKAVDALKEHRRRQAAERLEAGGAWQDNDLVFCREDGTPLDRWHVRKEFAKITKAAGSASRPLRQVIESVNWTFKGQLDLERHGGHTPEGIIARVLARILALTAAIWHNDKTGQPVMRSLTAFDH